VRPAERSAGAAAALILVAALMSGCAASPTEADWSVPELPVDVPVFSATSSLPFDSYQLPDAELQRMQEAHGQLLAECAAEYGADLEFLGDYTPPADLSFAAWGGRFGTLDASHASEFGYHASPDSAWAPVGGFYLRDPANLQPTDVAGSVASQIIMYGPEADPTVSSPVDAAGDEVPAGGCNQIVNHELGGEMVSIVGIEADVINLALEHPRVKSAIAAWVACMSAAGYRYDKVQQPANDYAALPLTAEEVDVATADVTCTASSRWADLYYAALTDYENQAIAHQSQQLEAVRSSQTDRLAKLDRLVGG
jgi:hypothetical protein